MQLVWLMSQEFDETCGLEAGIARRLNLGPAGGARL